MPHKHKNKEQKKKNREQKEREPEPEHSDEMDLLEAYNLADVIQTDWEHSAVPECAPLTVQWLDRQKASTPINVDDEVASETESVEDMDAVVERTQTLHDIDREEQLGVQGVPADEDQPDGDDAEDLEDFYMWPKFIDSIIYRLHDEVAVSKFLMNKAERKVYFGHRRKDRLPVVVIVSKEYDPRLRKGEVPREVRIMQHLRGQPNVSEMLGWCPVGQRHFVMVLRHYQSADMVDASNQNLFVISKMMESIFTALKQVHDHKVVHRDVAKSNLLWNPVTDTAIIIDFDNACFFRKNGYYRDAGRDRYDAPEKTEMLVARRKLKEKLAESYKKRIPSSKIKKRLQAYTEKADIYSVGVLLWMLINGHHHSPSPRKLKDWVSKIKQRNHHKKYAELDLLVRLLNFDPDRRLSLEDALQHPFIRDRPEHDDDYTHMKAYLFKKLNMDAECETLIDAWDKEEHEPTSTAHVKASDDRPRASADDNEEEEEEEDEEEEATGSSSDSSSASESEATDDDEKGAPPPEHRHHVQDEEEEEDDDDDKPLTPDDDDFDDHHETERKMSDPPQPPVATTSELQPKAATPLVSTKPPFMFAVPVKVSPSQ